MPRLRVLQFLLSVFIICQSPVRAGEVWNEQHLFTTYARSLHLVHPEFATEVLFLLDTGDVRTSHLSLLAEAQQVVTELGSGVENGDELLRSADAFLIPEVWKYLKQREFRPTTEEVIAYRNGNASRFRTKDWIIGTRILVQDGAPEEDLKLLQEKLSKPDSIFEQIASEYYRSQGEDNDGHFGRVERGQISDEVFNIFFHQDPSQSFFGPVRTKHGHLYGRLLDRGMEGFHPMEAIRPSIERAISLQRYKDFSSVFFGRLEEEQGLVRKWEPGGDSALPPDAVAFVHGEVEVTYGEVLRNLVEVLGDRTTFGFFESVTNAEIQARLILGSDEVNAVRLSPEYQLLRNALLTNERYYLLLEKEGEPSTDLVSLREFYDEMKEQLYAKPDELRFLVIEFPVNPKGETTPEERREYRKNTMETANRIRNALAGVEDPYSIQVPPPARRFVAYDWTALDEIPQAFQAGLDALSPGVTSEVLIERDLYVIYHLTEKRIGDMRPFEEVQDQVGFHLGWEHRKDVRRRLLEQAQSKARERILP